jgi:hypothetical protein
MSSARRSLTAMELAAFADFDVSGDAQDGR